MRFKKTRWYDNAGTDQCILVTDHWDDFRYKTLFILTYKNLQGEEFEIGPVKIMQASMPFGRVSIDDEFIALDASYCSLGQSQDYYEKLGELPDETRNDILECLRDCVYDPSIWSEFKEEDAMTTSLLRFVSISNVEILFPSALKGEAVLTPFDFTFYADAAHKMSLRFNVKPHSLPPSNVHVVIGRNGVGKTRLLAGIADFITEHKVEQGFGMNGRIVFDSDEGKFANIVAVSFSVFDRFDPIPRSRRNPTEYHYVGFKKIEEDEADAAFPDPDAPKPHVVQKSNNDLDREFGESIRLCMHGRRLQRWLNAMKCLSSDPGFAEFALQSDDDHPNLEFEDSIIEAFSSLSSGHKIVLLATTKLVECVAEKSLVLIDEPETHLHPPLLGSFVRALSALLAQRNGVAVVATHSPVVLQEVPARCVSIIRQSGEIRKADRPEIETFGENVGILTREVFNLEVLESGFHRLLQKAASEHGYDYESVIAAFGDQIGGEGRVIARSLCARKGQ